MTRPDLLRAGLLLCVGIAATACGGEDLVLPNQGEPASLTLVQGNQQSGTIGEAVSESLVVRVTDRFEDPVANALVTWRAEGGGSVVPDSNRTGADGRAATVRILGDVPGTYVTFATVDGVQDRVTFTTTAVAAKLLLTTQPSAIATTGTPFAQQPVLQLADPAGNPIARPEVTVTAQIAEGGGTLEGTATAVSTADGLVTFTDLAIRGSPGPRRLIFGADGFASATSDLVALGVGVPASMALSAGDQQSAAVGTAVPIAPAVVVKDADQNPLPGVPVTFSVTAGGGSVSGGSVTTGSDGIATVGQWILGKSVGTNRLKAEVTGSTLEGSPVVFTATSVPGPLSADKTTVEASPASITASNGSVGSAITVTARDGFGNPLQGLDVALAASGEGNTLTQPAGATNGSGAATGRLSSTRAGSVVVSATVAGTAIPQTATVAIVPAAPAASTSSATVPNGSAGSATTIAISLKDGFGNPVPGAASGISLQVTGANTANASNARDEGGGDYTASYTPIRTGTDQVQVRIGGSSVLGPFSSTVVAGPASPAQTTAVVTGGSVFFNRPITVAVQVRDAQNNPLRRGGDQVIIRVDGGDPISATYDAGRDVYAATAPHGATGDHQVAITLNGTPIAGSPFTATTTLF
jgi:Invasin, domain 3/Bacterial Ig-like domain (group 1)/Filamin/ABP280 repeat